MSKICLKSPKRSRVYTKTVFTLVWVLLSVLIFESFDMWNSNFDIWLFPHVNNISTAKPQKISSIHRNHYHLQFGPLQSDPRSSSENSDPFFDVLLLSKILVLLQVLQVLLQLCWLKLFCAAPPRLLPRLLRLRYALLHCSKVCD